MLRRVARSISRSFLRKDDFIARYGGEEFAIVLRDIPGATAMGLADRALHSIRGLAIEFEGSEPVEVTASIGVAELIRGEDSAAWIERADRALYAAKQDGRVRMHNEPLD